MYCPSTYAEDKESPRAFPSLITVDHKPTVKRNTCMHWLVCTSERFVCIDVHSWKYRDSRGRTRKVMKKFFVYIFLFLLLCLGYIAAFTKVLTIYQIYHTWICPLHHFPLSPPLHSWNSFNRSHFSLTFMCTQQLHCTHPPTPFPHFLPYPTGTNPKDRICSARCSPKL
jgi:hypothetical protein